MPEERLNKPRRGLRDWRTQTTIYFLSTISPSTLSTWRTTLNLPDDAPLDLSLPKRYLTYEPLVLFPSGSLPSGPGTLLSLLTPEEQDTLWTLALQELSQKSGMTLTHVAVNAGIPLFDSAETRDAVGLKRENVIRAPTGLREVYGDFGKVDGSFDETLWVWTQQNGLWQTWAPRCTMFSRGNVVEKARLLAFHEELGKKVAGASELPREVLEARITEREMGRKERGEMFAVDMYAGIGYFVFSYAESGFRVLGWELNEWSVEGLRRGAERNGWSVRVVKGDKLKKATTEIVGDDNIIIFMEDNCHAERRIQELKNSGRKIPVVHVNGGLLPHCEGSWEGSVKVTEGSQRAWLHLHENVSVNDIERRGKEIEKRINEMVGPSGRRAKGEFAMKVKTFAPGVWHIVYDIVLVNNDV